MSLYSPAQVRKAIGTAVVGVYAWAQFVVNSAPAHITANEWLLLGGVGVAVLAVFGLTNAPVEPAEVAKEAVELAEKEVPAFTGGADQPVPPAV